MTRRDSPVWDDEGADEGLSDLALIAWWLIVGGAVAALLAWWVVA